MERAQFGHNQNRNIPLCSVSCIRLAEDNQPLANSATHCLARYFYYYLYYSNGSSFLAPCVCGEADRRKSLFPPVHPSAPGPRAWMLLRKRHAHTYPRPVPTRRHLGRQRAELSFLSPRPCQLEARLST